MQDGAWGGLYLRKVSVILIVDQSLEALLDMGLVLINHLLVLLKLRELLCNRE